MTSLPVLSFVVPCLNEALCIRAVIEDCKLGGRHASVPFEVVVADNGSTDGSQQIAVEAGARVVNVSERGYGEALLDGISDYRGDYILMGDADGTYDFKAASLFLSRLQDGADLVMGNRFRGLIESVSYTHFRA